MQLEIMNQKAIRIMSLLKQAGARDALVVGGYVRDLLLGIPSKDIDIEVYGMSYDDIVATLQPHYAVNLVGKTFGVINIENELDISVPRRDNKIGVGHRGFDVSCDPNMSIEDAAARRDFTINSMAMDIDGNIIDSHNGQTDLDVRCLRATSPKTFIEDPLRVMRAMQFAARFNMWIHPDTEELCRSMAHQKVELSKERIWEEWKKWALKGVKPSDGLMVLSYANWLEPEIRNIRGVPQDPAWHPEGEVLAHTCHVVDQAAIIARREQLEDDQKLILMFAALCHDFGKASTTEFIDGHWRARGHCEASAPLAESFLERIGAPKFVAEHVKPLVIEHLIHSGAAPTPRVIRRLANRLAPSNINMLSMLIESDYSGRPPLPKGNPFQPYVDLANSMEIGNDKPQPILMGRHLIDLGVEPGRYMGVLLKDAFDAQLDGKFHDLASAKIWVIDHIKAYNQ